MDNGNEMFDCKIIKGELSHFSPIRVLLVNGSLLEKTWDQLVHRYHYLGYTKMYGPRIKYLAMHSISPLQQSAIIARR